MRAAVAALVFVVTLSLVVVPTMQLYCSASQVMHHGAMLTDDDEPSPGGSRTLATIDARDAFILVSLTTARLSPWDAPLVLPSVSTDRFIPPRS
jgi:hypothetical protein